MIRGYPQRPSIAPGGRLVLHVASDAPWFRVAFLRWSDGFEAVARSGWLPGRAAPDGDAAHDWRWPAYAFDIPTTWRSGAYVAHLQAALEDRSPPGQSAGSHAPIALEPHDAGRRGGLPGRGEPLLPASAAEAGALPHIGQTHAAALFTLRGPGTLPILYKLPLATYHAYNWMGGGCFYDRPPRSVDPPGSRVTFLRPGGGIGGDTHGALDAYDLASARQTFAHWDAPFIAWLTRQGYAADFCTDLDIHRDPALLARYRLVVSVGHDEYWSEPTRDAMEAYIAAGGNAAFFGANLCWWRIHLVDDATAMVCHQGGPRGALDHWWPATGASRPEDCLTGVSYRHGGGWWDGPRRTDGYVVCAPDHWVFDGTVLRAGDRLGRDTMPPLVGYECDGAPLSRFDPATGAIALAPEACNSGTPAGLQALAAGLLSAEWNELPPRDGLRAGEGIHAATMIVHGAEAGPGATREGRGVVFTAGTTDWAQVLAQDWRVARITRNVIDRLTMKRA
jgi:hypothetical protein